MKLKVYVTKKMLLDEDSGDDTIIELELELHDSKKQTRVELELPIHDGIADHYFGYLKNDGCVIWSGDQPAWPVQDAVDETIFQSGFTPIRLAGREFGPPAN